MPLIITFTATELHGTPQAHFSFAVLGGHVNCQAYNSLLAKYLVIFLYGQYNSAQKIKIKEKKNIVVTSCIIGGRGSTV